MGDDEPRTVRLQIEVEDCGIVYLADKELRGYAGTPAQSTGIIKTVEGHATLRIAPQWGPADFTVTIADRDPGADLAGYEDIVEVSFGSFSGLLEMTGFTFDEHVMSPLPPLPAGPGVYRVRYHVKGMDGEGTQDAVDDHYLQIWPMPLEEPVVLKTATDITPEKDEWGGT
ncbi:hypothetical protein [Streptosporangium sp. NPDC002721]|uniref:hypothetical protein n=1 Tax=Streptosporangium sp. NPDC002721 TaxID=3366188 RepID=UPI00367F808B